MGEIAHQDQDHQFVASVAPLASSLSNLKFETHVAVPIDTVPHLARIRRSLSTRTAIRGRGDIPKRLFLFSYWSFHLKGAPTSYTRQQRVIHIHNQEDQTNAVLFRYLYFNTPGDSELGASRQGLATTARICRPRTKMRPA